MAEARQREEWTRTSWVLAMIRNSQAAKRSDCIKPEDVNPYHPKHQRRRRDNQDELASNRRAVGEMLAARAKR